VVISVIASSTIRVVAVLEVAERHCPGTAHTWERDRDGEAVTSSRASCCCWPCSPASESPAAC